MSEFQTARLLPMEDDENVAVWLTSAIFGEVTKSETKRTKSVRSSFGRIVKLGPIEQCSETVVFAEEKRRRCWSFR